MSGVVRRTETKVVEALFGLIRGEIKGRGGRRGEEDWWVRGGRGTGLFVHTKHTHTRTRK